MPRMRFPSLCAVLLLAPAIATGTIYKVVDEHGNITYTDAPPADQRQAEPVRLPAINTSPPTEVRSRGTSASEPDDETGERSYRSARISAPENDFTVTAGQQELTVEVSLEPSLQEGHWVQVLVDGSAAGSPSQGTRYTLRELERGMHFISAQVMNSDGRVIAETDPVTVHVQRPIVGGPTGGQPRPPGAPPRPSAPN